MSGKFIVPIQLPLLFTKPDNNPAEGYYKLYLRDDKLRKMDWLGIEEEIGGTDITTTQISNWDEAYSWGNHADAGYVTLSTEQNITGYKRFNGGAEIRSSFTFNPDGLTNNFLQAGTDRWFRIHHDTTDWVNSHLFRPEQGFNRVDHYGKFSGTYNTGHQYNFYDSDDLSTTAGLWNISFLKGNAAIATRPLITINNGQGAGIFNTPLFKLFANGNLVLGLSTDPGYKLTVNGSIRATSYVVTSGTSAQFLKADGSLDSNTYLTSGGASGAYVSLSGSYANPSWITSLAYSKITGVPAFLLAETDTLDTVTGRGATTANAISVGGLTVATNLIYTDTVNSRVGIGTITPSKTLTVNGDVSIPNNASYFTKSTSGSELSVFKADTSNNIQIGSIFFGGGQINYTATNFDWYQYPSSVLTQRMRLWGTTGNLTIQNGGTFTDAGYKLDVNGTARVQGTTTITPAANTSAIVSTGYSVTGSDSASLVDLSGTWNTTGTPTLIKANLTDTASNASSFLIDLQVAGSSQFRVRKDGYARASQGFVIGTSNGNDLVSSNGGEAYAAGGLFTSLRFASSFSEGYGLTISGFNASTRTNTSGTAGVLQLAHGFAPTSGVGTFIGLLYRGTINQTGGAIGLTRGLYVNPTLTAAADWRSIEWSNNTGWGLYGAGTALNYLAGNLLINTTTDAGFRLDVQGIGRFTGLLRGDSGFVVGGSATTNTANARFWSNGGQAATSGLYRTLYADITWIPTSGTAEWYGVDLRPTINQTGSANGITRGLYINPTLTAAADWRSIEWSNSTGWGLYGAGTANNYLNGSLFIGTSTDAGYKLDVNGTTRFIGVSLIRESSATSVGLDFTAGNLPNIKVTGNTGSTFLSGRGKGIGVFNSSTDPTAKFQVGGIYAASSALATGLYVNTELQATANNDVLVGLDIKPVYTTGAYTGVKTYALRVQGDIYGTTNVSVEGIVTGTVVRKQGGTSTQFMKADGSVDNNSYATNDLSIAYAIALG